MALTGSREKSAVRSPIHDSRDFTVVTREVAQLERFGLVRVAEEVHPGHGRMKKVSAVAGEIRLEAVIA